MRDRTNFDLRFLTESDIPAAMALVGQAGWNQTSDDWMRFLAASPQGCFALVADGKLAGTAATIVYAGCVAWIGMVIVDRDYRKRGFGRRLLMEACAYLDRVGISCVKLDATPEGEPLYEKHGFVREHQLERCELVRQPLSSSSHIDITAVSEEALDLDISVFGADRRTLLRSIRDDSPDLAMELRDGSSVRGYALGRRGLRADHLGPWMATDEPTAEQLLEEFMARSSRPRLFVDCVVRHPYAMRLLEAHGFQRSRPLLRMSRGTCRPADDGDLLAITGPEFG